MKKTLVIALLVLAALSCQKKEEPKGGFQEPAGVVQTEAEMRLLEDVLKKEPGNRDAWIKLGNLLMDSSRFNEAINAYQKALDIDPKDVDARVDMGTCYKNVGKPEKAVEEYRKVLKINPNHLNAQRNLAVVLAFDLKDNAQAIKEFERYLQLAPSAPDADRIRQTIETLKASK